MLQRKLKQARNAYVTGAFAKAAALCGDILERAPRNPAALHLLAMTMARLGEGSRARELLRRALAADPHNPRFAADLGACELEAGDASEAESCLRRAIALGERTVPAFSWLGIALTRQGKHDAAAAAFQDALALQPADAGLLLNLGHALRQSGRLHEALGAYGRALSHQPDHVEALTALGDLRQEQGDFEQAVQHYRDALKVQPGHPEAHNNLGNALHAQGKETEAQSHYEHAIALEPGYAQAHYNLGELLQSQRRFGAAIERYRRTLELDGAQVLAHHHLGTALLEHGDAGSARVCFEKALELDSSYAKAHVSLGAAALDEGNTAAALEHYQRALALDTNSADAQYGIALSRLFRREFDQAWMFYERRTECEEVGPLLRTSQTLQMLASRPRWAGPGAGAAPVGIWGEQGIGDQLLFSTLIPELIAADVAFVYEIDRRLIAAYERSFPGQRFVEWSDPPHPALIHAERALLSGSLPSVFRRHREDFARQPERLLQAQPERVAHFRERLAHPGSGLKVALAWRSARNDRVGPRKSVPLAELEPLLRVPQVRFVDVQYGDTREERARLVAAGITLVHFDDLDAREDLDSLLALLEACDLVITTSNATAHLAGTLGKRTWLCIPGRPPFHYWVPDERGRSLWYPAVEILRSPQPGGWAALVEHVSAKLKKLIEHVPTEREH